MKAKYKGRAACVPDPASPNTVISKRPQWSGAAYEQEVVDAMKSLRESAGMKAIPTRARK